MSYTPIYFSLDEVLGASAPMAQYVLPYLSTAIQKAEGLNANVNVDDKVRRYKEILAARHMEVSGSGGPREGSYSIKILRDGNSRYVRSSYDEIYFIRRAWGPQIGEIEWVQRVDFEAKNIRDFLDTQGIISFNKDSFWEKYGTLIMGVGVMTAFVGGVALLGAGTAAAAAVPAAVPAAAAPSSGGVLSSISAGVQSAYATVASVVNSTVVQAAGAVSSITKAVESAGSKVTENNTVKDAADLYKKGEAVFTTVKDLTAKGSTSQDGPADQVSEGSPTTSENTWLLAVGMGLFAILIIGGRK